MKTTILIIGLSVALMEHALGQTNQPASPSEEANQIPPGALVTKLGTVYNKFHIERVDPAGLTISYLPDGGGIGIEKVPFNVLSEDWQRRYGYDPEKAAQFDAAQKQAMAQWRAQMIADEKAYRERRAQQEAAEEAAAEQVKKDAEAAAAQATNSPAMTDTNQPATNQPAPPSPPGGY
jgi:hypothetical protein